MVEGRFVAEQEEAFAVGVEPTDGVDAFGEMEGGEGGPLGASLRGELGEDAVRFMEGKQHRWRRGRAGYGDVGGNEKTGSGDSPFFVGRSCFGSGCQTVGPF